ncbi:MAG TPA: hypothetical protein ENK18_05320 [Deltaproteobacteria bacterium]|nr:hypothetical protein [Deltaproteobacteria bacterium]
MIRGLQRRLATGFNALFVTILVTAIVVVSIGLAGRHRWRLDLSSDAIATLSPDTRAALALLETRDVDLRITAFGAQRRDREAWIRDRTIRDLLRELEHASDRVQTRFVDFDRERLTAESFGVERYGTVVIEGRGDRVDLIEREVFRARGPKGDRELEFLGEAAISAAIRQVLSDRAHTVYLLSGHGEREIYDRGLGELKGLAQLIDDQGWTARTLDLLRDAGSDTPPTIPEDASAVLLLGPRAPVTPIEEEVLRDYLGRGGSLGVFVDPGGVPPSLLDEVGVHTLDGTVLDVVAYFPHADRPLLSYGPHPITEELAAGNIATVVAHAAPIELEPRSGVRSAELLRTSRRGWIERGDDDPAAYTPGEDLEGPVVVGGALTVAAPHPWITSATARLVVVGDVDLISDELLEEAPGNATFVANSLRWLLRADERFSRVGRPARARRLALTEADLQMIQWLVMGGMPLLVLLGGGGVWAWRRQQ